MPHDRCIICGTPASESRLSQAGVCQNCIVERLQKARAQMTKREDPQTKEPDHA